MRLELFLIFLGAFVVAMTIGWLQPIAIPAPSASYARHMSGGADLRANNPFAVGAKP